MYKANKGMTGLSPSHPPNYYKKNYLQYASTEDAGSLGSP